MSTVPLTADDEMPEVPQPHPSASPNELFMAGSVPHGADVRVRFGNGFLISLLTHIGSVLLIFFIITHMPPPAPSVTPPERNPDGIIWTQVTGPGGGGGGGGNRMPEPPKKAELPGKEKVTIPVTKPPVLAPEPPKETPKPAEQLNIPAVTTAANIAEMPGALSGLPTPSQGIGVGGGAGTGRGTGIGPGQGSGLGPGYGGGTGGGPYRPGNDVSWPKLIYEKKPAYTADAMRAKVQGVVEVEALVLPDGSVGDAKVTRSLDQTFGLDREALIAVRQWKFAPAIRRGQAVPVLVPIEVSFTLR
jgi:periplasmic protein TonB